MAEVDSTSLTGRYEALLWWTIDLLGVSKSIERKVVTAVGIQFAVTVCIFVLPFLLSGTLWYLLAGLLFTGAIVALVNTLLIVRRDFTEPIRDLEQRASAIAAGDIEATVQDTEGDDEIFSALRERPERSVADTPEL